MQFTYHSRSITLQGFSEDDWIYRGIADSGTFYEIDLLDYIRFVLPEREGCVLDIGANIGNHSVYFGLFVTPMVICFEPNPAVLPILERNLKANRIEYKLFHLGLGEREGQAVVELPDAHGGNIGTARLHEAPAGADSVIRVATLDSLLPEIEDLLQGQPVKALKADVEGMEAAVLRGAGVLLQRYTPDLFLEIATEGCMREIESILLPLGYRRLVSWAATPVWHFMHERRLTTWLRTKIAFYTLWHRLLRKLRRWAGQR